MRSRQTWALLIVDGVLSGTCKTVRFKSTSFLYIDAVMTIRQIANRIIKDIKAWPEEARKSQDVDGPKTSWDAYKEQIQYEEYDSFEVFVETIESMVRDKVSELSEKDIEKMYCSLYRNYYPSDLSEKKSDIVTSILSYIKREAELQDIEYNKPDIEFIRYYVADHVIVAEVLAQVGPEEFLIRGYSEATSSLGEQGVANLSYLDFENGMERITVEEFERIKNSLKPESTLKEQVLCLTQTDSGDENGSQKNKNQLDSESMQNDQLNDPNLILEDKLAKEKARIHKTVKDLVILTAKATNKSPAEILRGMKSILDERKAKRDEQNQHAELKGANPIIKIKENNYVVDTARQAALPNNLNVGLDRDTRLAGITLSGILIESGTKKFEDYVKAMISDIGPEIKPYLKQFYSAARFEPGFDTTGMTSHDDVDIADVEKIIVGTKLT
jgi:hypothetical protein